LRRQALLPLCLLTLLVLSAGVPSVAAIGSKNVFTVISTTWGTPSAPAEVGPGSLSATLTVSVEYTGTYEATAVQGSWTGAMTTFSNANGDTLPTANAVSVQPNTMFQLTYSLNVASTAAIGSYTIPIWFQYTTSESGTSVVSSETDSANVNLLGTTSLTYQSPKLSLNAGVVNNVTVTMTNTGSGSASQLATTVSTSVGSVLGTLPTISTLGASSSVPLSFGVYLPSSSSGGPVSLTFTTTWTDAYGIGKSGSQTLAFYAGSVPLTNLNFSASSDSLVPGKTNEIPITLTNLGPGSVSSVLTTISAPSSFSVLTQSPNVAQLGQGQSFTSKVGIYVPASAAGSSVPLTLTGTYTDPYGISRSFTQTLGLYVITITEPVLTFTAVQTSVAAAQTNSIEITLANLGPGTVSTLHTTISSSQVSVLSQLPTVQSLGPGSSVNDSISVYTPQSDAGSPVTMTISFTFTDQYGNLVSSSQPLYLYVGSVSLPSLYFKTLRDSLTPGGIDVVTLVISNIGSSDAMNVTTTASVTSGSVLSQFPVISDLKSGSSTDATIKVYVPESAAGSSLSLAVSSSFQSKYATTLTSTQALGLYVVANTPAILTLTFVPSQYSVIAGKVNTIPLKLVNNGTQAVTYIASTASVGTITTSTVGSATTSQLGSILAQFPSMRSLAAGSSVKGNLTIYIPASAAGASLPISFSTNYVDSYGDNQTATQTLDFFVSGTPVTTSGDTIAVSAVKNAVTVGTMSPVSLMIKDTGSSPLYSPTVSLAVSSPLVVMQNSSVSMPGTVVNPGGTLSYGASLASATSAALGYYTGTLTINFQDQFGNSVTQNVPVGFTLQSYIELVVQSPTVAQSNNTIVVSGSLLNEGFSSAYYASVSAALGTAKPSSTASYYAGEVDPNTPVPFSVTIPYTSRSRTNQPSSVTLALSYQDSLGASKQSSISVPVTLSSGSQPSSTTSATSSSSQNIVVYIEYAIVAVLVAVVIVGTVFVRRSRKQFPRSEEEEDKAVI